jgi:PII-like signaling protein
MIAPGLKLDVYFGESLAADEALMACFARHGLEAAALYRGIEGYGLGRRLHRERFPDISTDLPLIAEAIDTRERIEAVLDDVDAIVDRGLVTLEPSLLVTGDDARDAEFPAAGAGTSGRLTVYCGRRGRAHRAVVEQLRRAGAQGATVLLGVDGIHDGRRSRAGLLSRNADVPMATIAVGPVDALTRVLHVLPDVVERPVANLERIAVLKHDGEALEPLPRPADSLWIALRVYARRSNAIFTALTRRLRAADAAGVTTVLGEWGFSADERPFGDRFGTIASHVPTYTVLVDRPERIAELWPVVDEVTERHGVVTAALVPAYRERARS